MDWVQQYDKSIRPLELSDIHGKNILSEFRRNVLQKPSSPLLVYYERVLSVAEVDRLSSSFAVSLRTISGIGRGDRSLFHVCSTLTRLLLQGRLVSAEPA